jgi:hypothetical protein
MEGRQVFRARDIWVGNSLLSVQFPPMYLITDKKKNKAMVRELMMLSKGRRSWDLSAKKLISMRGAITY